MGWGWKNSEVCDGKSLVCLNVHISTNCLFKAILDGAQEEERMADRAPTTLVNTYVLMPRMLPETLTLKELVASP